MPRLELGMRRRWRVDEFCWAHIFDGNDLSGTGRRVGPGTRTSIHKVQSFIVGPQAIVELVGANMQPLQSLPPLKIIENVSKLSKRKRIRFIRVIKMEVAENPAKSLPPSDKKPK